MKRLLILQGIILLLASAVSAQWYGTDPIYTINKKVQINHYGLSDSLRTGLNRQLQIFTPDNETALRISGRWHPNAYFLDITSSNYTGYTRCYNFRVTDTANTENVTAMTIYGKDGSIVVGQKLGIGNTQDTSSRTPRQLFQLFAQENAIAMRVSGIYEPDNYYLDLVSRTYPTGSRCYDFKVHDIGGTTDTIAMTILGKNGNVLIGKSEQYNSLYRLDVNGKIRANEVVVNTTGSDFVFEPGYNLTALDQLEQQVRANKHLPGILPAKEMQANGISIGEMQTKMLQKIEELTLYIIEQNKKINDLEIKCNALRHEREK